MCDPALRGSLALGLLARLRSLRWLPAAPLRPGVGFYTSSFRMQQKVYKPTAIPYEDIKHGVYARFVIGDTHKFSISASERPVIRQISESGYLRSAISFAVSRFA